MMFLRQKHVVNSLMKLAPDVIVDFVQATSFVTKQRS